MVPTSNPIAYLADSVPTDAAVTRLLHKVKEANLPIGEYRNGK